MDSNKAFLEYFAANDLHTKSNKELMEIRAAFVVGFNQQKLIVDKIRAIIEAGNAPNYGELRPSEDIVHDAYCEIVNVIFSQHGTLAGGGE